MWSLLHAAESFDDEPYVRDALRVLPLLNESSKRWSEILIMRIINSETAQAQLVREVRIAADERRAAVRSVCGRIHGNNPRLAQGLAVLNAELA